MRNQDLFDSFGARVSDHTGTPAVLLDRSFRIRAVNAEYERATLRNSSELIGENIFEAFPDNPHDPRANGNEKLLASFETVLRTKSTVAILQRYDITDSANAGEFIPKVWVPKNMPVRDGSEVVGIVSHVTEVTDANHAVLELAREIETNTEGDLALSPAELLHMLAAFTDALPRDRGHRKALLDENEQLRRALETRDTIGQAKGILMERFNTDAMRAFEILVKLSQESNTRVADLAHKLVKVEHPPQL
jgi:ANTAR domain-containing protein/PAS domain-containing protein